MRMNIMFFTSSIRSIFIQMPPLSRYLWSLFLLPLFQTILVAAPMQTMDYEDIISIAKPRSITLSPNGSKVAFVTRHGELKDNRNLDTLYLMDLKKDQQEKALQCDQILQVSWGTEENGLYALCKEDDLYNIRLLSPKKNTTLITSSEPISLFALSPDGSHLSYTVTKSTPDEIVKERIESGYVYQWGEDDVVSVLFENTYRYLEREEIWCTDVTTKTSNMVTELSFTEGHSDIFSIAELHISENGRFLLMKKWRYGHSESGETPFTADLHVWDTVKKEWYRPLPESLKNKETVCWINDNEFIFQEHDYSAQSLSSSLWLCNADTQTVTSIDWLLPLDCMQRLFLSTDKKRLFGISREKIYSIALNEKTVKTISLPTALQKQELSFDNRGRLIASVAEDSNTPPEVTLYNLETEKMSTLTHLNPFLDSLSRGHVERIEIPTGDGESNIGYLVHPINEQPGKQYPIIIGSYGFGGNWFIADGEWHSSFPAQPLAAEGYLVLLLNRGESAQDLVGNPEKARQMEGWSLLPLFENAVDLLVQRGIGDPTKVGLYGWSHGGFVVEFLISHSNKFHVACIGEGGDYNPSGFWMGGHSAWPKIFQNIFGGPPWGKSLPAYLDFSPFFQVDKISCPLLMEFVAPGSGAMGLEMYTPLRYLGIPAELVVYPGEEHNFVKPKARVASMARKLDWFNYWLLGKRDPDPKKLEQYERWDHMHSEWKQKAN